MRRAIWWIRRDLRLYDNQALHAAVSSAEQVLPLFILDDHLLKASTHASKRLAFLYEGLRRLDARLRRLGSRLLVLRGDPLPVLSSLVTQGYAQIVCAEADYTPYARRRDARIQSVLPLNLVGSSTILPPGSILKPDGRPYTVFTPFSRAWQAALPSNGFRLLPAPTRLHTPPEPEGIILPETPSLSPDIPFTPGEAEALRLLERFTSGARPPVYDYGEGRNRLDTDGTSRLSPYLRFGMLSPRHAAEAALQAIQAASDEAARKGAESWLNELIWRDFYAHILFHFPHVLRQNFRLGEIPWINNTIDFRSWCEGRTGYPIVDAAMRQLTQTGWMHNRARMIVASFLTKDLLIDWRWGEAFFMQHLIDGDIASNNGGWQWTAGTGTDAAPFFRIFNPITQGKKFDPSGKYIRTWVPELQHVPDEFVHEPWCMPPEAQKRSNCKIGGDYPAPIIDHAWARQRALSFYYRGRNSTGA